MREDGDREVRVGWTRTDRQVTMGKILAVKDYIMAYVIYPNVLN